VLRRSQIKIMVTFDEDGSDGKKKLGIVNLDGGYRVKISKDW
jgi:hypothetical protein